MISYTERTWRNEVISSRWKNRLAALGVLMAMIFSILTLMSLSPKAVAQDITTCNRLTVVGNLYAQKLEDNSFKDKAGNKNISDTRFITSGRISDTIGLLNRAETDLANGCVLVDIASGLNSENLRRSIRCIK